MNSQHLSAVICAAVLSISSAALAQTSTNPSNTTNPSTTTTPSTPTKPTTNTPSSSSGMSAPNNPAPGMGQPGTQGGQGTSSSNLAHEQCQRLADSAQRTSCLNDIKPSAGSNTTTPGTKPLQ
jgi:hypothetical protein